MSRDRRRDPELPPPVTFRDRMRAELHRRFGSHGPVMWTAVITAAVAVTAALAWFMYAFDPLKTPFYPKCPSKTLLGIDCPGCGTARAVHALVHGDIGTAWHYNPFLFFAVALLAVLAVAPGFTPQSRLRRVIDSPAFVIAVTVLIILWTVARNIWLPID